MQRIVRYRPGSGMIWSRQFPVPSGATSKCLGRYDTGNRKFWPMSYHFWHLAILSISLGPDFQSNFNGTTHLIFWKHPGKIFVYSCLGPAIKVAIWDQLGLYCYKSLLRHTLPILPGPDFWRRSDGALHIAIKVLRGNMHRHIAVAVQSMCTICFCGTTI